MNKKDVEATKNSIITIYLIDGYGHKIGIEHELVRVYKTKGEVDLDKKYKLDDIELSYLSYFMSGDFYISDGIYLKSDIISKCIINELGFSSSLVKDQYKISYNGLNMILFDMVTYDRLLKISIVEKPLYNIIEDIRKCIKNQ